MRLQKTRSPSIKYEQAQTTKVNEDNFLSLLENHDYFPYPYYMCRDLRFSSRTQISPLHRGVAWRATVFRLADVGA